MSRSLHKIISAYFLGLPYSANITHLQLIPNVKEMLKILHIIVINIEGTCVLLRRSKVILKRTSALTHVNRNLLFNVLTQYFLRMVKREIIFLMCLQKTQSKGLKQKTIKTVIYDETLQLVSLNVRSHTYIYLWAHMCIIC